MANNGVQHIFHTRQQRRQKKRRLTPLGVLLRLSAVGFTRGCVTLLLLMVGVAAVTRRDPTIVPRVWPVAEAFTAMILLDHLMQHRGFQAMAKK